MDFAPDSTGNERAPPTDYRRRDDAAAACARRASRHAAAGTAAPAARADGAQLRVDRRRGDRDLPRAALPGSRAYALPHRRDPRVPRHAYRPMGGGAAHLARRRDNHRGALVRLHTARAVPRAHPARAVGGHACGAAHSRPRFAGPRPHFAVARAAIRHHHRPRHGLAEGAPRREHGRRARPFAVAAVGPQDGVAHRRVDPRQPRAHPGRDVLPAARLGHDRRAPVHAGSAPLASQDARHRRRHRPRARRIPARPDHGDDRAGGVLRDRAHHRRPRQGDRDRPADRAPRVHSLRRVRARPHARRARGAAAMDGVARVRCGARGIRRRPAHRERTCSSRISSATGSGCIRSR